MSSYDHGDTGLALFELACNILLMPEAELG